MSLFSWIIHMLPAASFLREKVLPGKTADTLVWGLSQWFWEEAVLLDFLNVVLHCCERRWWNSIKVHCVQSESRHLYRQPESPAGPNLTEWAQIEENGKEIIIASCCPECGATVNHRRSALPVRLVAHQRQHSPSVLSPQLHYVGRLWSFSLQISLMYLFSRHNGRWEEGLQWNYAGMYSGISMSEILKARASVKLWVTEINTTLTSERLQYLSWTVLPFLRPRHLSDADKYHLRPAADGITIHPGNE